MSKHWWFKFPGEAYAVRYDFVVMVTEAYARYYVRCCLGRKRLPKGTQVWKEE